MFSSITVFTLNLICCISLQIPTSHLSSAEGISSVPPLLPKITSSETQVRPTTGGKEKAKPAKTTVNSRRVKKAESEREHVKATTSAKDYMKTTSMQETLLKTGLSATAKGLFKGDSNDETHLHDEETSEQVEEEAGEVEKPEEVETLPAAVDPEEVENETDEAPEAEEEEAQDPSEDEGEKEDGDNEVNLVPSTAHVKKAIKIGKMFKSLNAFKGTGSKNKEEKRTTTRKIEVKPSSKPSHNGQVMEDEADMSVV